MDQVILDNLLDLWYDFNLLILWWWRILARLLWRVARWWWWITGLLITAISQLRIDMSDKFFT